MPRSSGRDVASLEQQAGTAVAQAEHLGRQAAGLVLVARNLRRGAPHPWRGARVSGGVAAEEIPRQHAGQRRFAGRPEDARAVRLLVRGAATEAGVDADAAVLAASEMAANVILHAETPFTVTVEARPGAVHVEFRDGSAILPAVAHMVREGSAHGRGMQIVEAVTDRWGTDLTADGKVVWFEIGP